MEFNATRGNSADATQGIIGDIDFICGTNSSEYSVPHKTRNVNNWYDQCVAEILDSMDSWDFQGEIATANLSANQHEYPFPTDILKIKRLEVDYNGDGEYVRAKPMDPGSINETIASSAEINDYWDTGSPEFEAFDQSLFIFPVPDTNRTSGLKIWYTKEVAHFSAFAGSAYSTGDLAIAGNTAEPVFARPFHRILSLGASLDYASANSLDDIIQYCRDQLFGPSIRGNDRMGGLISKMKEFYSTRASDKILRLRSKYTQENYK